MAHISGRVLPSHAQVAHAPPSSVNRSFKCQALQRTQQRHHGAAQSHKFSPCLTARHDARTPRYTPSRAKRRIEDDEDDIIDDMDDDFEEDDADIDEDEEDVEEEEDDDLEAALDDGEPDDDVGEAFRRQRRGRVDLGDDDDTDLAELLEDDDLDALSDEEDLPTKQRSPRPVTQPVPSSPWLQAFVEDDEDEQKDEAPMDEGLMEEDDPAAAFPPRPPRAYRLQELLLKAGHEEAAQVVHEAMVTGLQDAPERVQPGDLAFIYGATPEARSDAAATAVAGGAVALLAEGPLQTPGGVTCAVVEDLATAAQRLAVAFYDDPSTRLTTIGFVGSAGKTTTAWLVRGIFEEVEQSTGMMGSIEYALEEVRLDEEGEVWVPSEADPTLERDSSTPYHIAPYQGKYPFPPTTPNGLRCQKVLSSMADRGAGVALLELDINGLRAGVDENIDLDVLVFTNVLKEQAELAGLSVEEYAETVGQTFAQLNNPARHRAIVNMDDPHVDTILRFIDDSIPRLGYSFARREGSSVWVDRIKYSAFETEILVRTPVVKMQIKTTLLGRQNVYNVLAAVAAGLPFTVPSSPVPVAATQVVQGIEAVEVIPGRCEVLDEGQAFPVVIDAAHTPAALARLLDSLREVGARTIWLVMGCKGGQAAHLRPYMGEVAHYKADWVLVTNDNPRREDPADIVNDIVAGFPEWVHRYESTYPYLVDPMHVPDEFHRFLWAYQSAVKKYVIEDRHSAIRAAVGMAGARDFVVVVGKGHEDYQEYDDPEGNIVRGWFDDRVECRNALSKLGMLYAIRDLDRKEIPWTRYPEEREEFPPRTTWVPARFLQSTPLAVQEEEEAVI